MKKVSKILSLASITIMLICIATNVFAATGVAGVSSPGTYTGKDVSGLTDVTNVGNQIITILTTIGVIASVIVLIVLGIKYMMGSAEEKAEYKKTMMPYIIGAALVFAASAIAGMLYSFLTNVGGK